MSKRRVPVRTCVACRTSGSKSGLLRVVRTPSSDVVLDISGKMSGRGVYVCPTVACIRKAAKEKRLSRALRVEVPEVIVRQLEEVVEQGSRKM